MVVGCVCVCMTEEIEIEFGTSVYVFEWDGEVATLVRVEDRMEFAESSHTSGLPTPVFNELRWKTDNSLTMDRVDISTGNVVENL